MSPLHASRGRYARASLPWLAFCASWCACDPSSAHGFAGKRFFPATLVTDDPFVADELSLLTVSQQNFPAGGDEPATRETEISFDVSKRLTQNFGIGFGAAYLQLQPARSERQRGWDNLEMSLKYQFYENDEHETILSAGMDVDLGGTGSKRVGREPFSTFTPALFFGKGFGDLPEDAKFLRPLAITGQLGVSIPSSASSTSINDEGEPNVEQHPNFFQ